MSSSALRGRIILTDHDGTLTDSEREMAEYSEIVVKYNAATLGIGINESERGLNAAKSQILSKPGYYGWEWGPEELIVAAATSDHYIFNQVATGLMLESLTESDPAMRRKVEELGGKGQYITDLFFQCSPKLGTYYRPEAKKFLLELSKLGVDWAVVTNSDASKVSKKLATLNLDFEPRVLGGARKYEVDRTWTGLVPVGQYKSFGGYPKRGVELQRKTFYDVLAREAGSKLQNLLVVEDVGEFVAWIDYLSESNPEWGGARTALLTTPMTPAWEKKRYGGEHKTRFGSDSLLAILEWIAKQ